MINTDRLADTFKQLVEIDSVSKQEGEFAGELQRQFEALGAETVVDDAGSPTGSNTGNLIVRLKGDRQVPPLLLNAHMDTVQPGEGIRAIYESGKFSSRGDTILGADDKSAVAILLETVRVLKENNLAHGPLELVFTICEEIGLIGAKNLDFSLISANYGYALDATDTEGIVTRAPSANRFQLTIYGKDAHAGAHPEKGINAIMLASKALSGLSIGRIDQETTCNIGKIEGGLATNIVPPTVTVCGEVRSHDEEKLNRVTKDILDAFEKTVNEYKSDPGEDLPRLEIMIEKDFSCTHVPEDHPVVTLAQQAAGNLGQPMQTKISGGGADANIFFEKGITVGVLGTGMREVHTVREYVMLEDMVKTTALLLEIIRLHAAGD
jgi:tripeptide aminopeptidase